MSKPLELDGQKFGRWTVLYRSDRKDKNGSRSFWICKCECGKFQDVARGSLVAGLSNGCMECYVKKNKGPQHACWKGGKQKEKAGYVKLWNGGFPRREHVLIAEKILGRRLRPKEVVHRVNGNKQDNRHTNLLICDSSYHRWFENKMADLYKKEHFS